MSVRRFIGYFVALSACSTIAFASFLIEEPPLQDISEGDSVFVSLAGQSAHLAKHKLTLKPIQVAQTP